jgi:hypothetical protein
MAAFNRPTEATYEVHENISVDTQGMIRWMGALARCEGTATPNLFFRLASCR